MKKKVVYLNKGSENEFIYHGGIMYIIIFLKFEWKNQKENYNNIYRINFTPVAAMAVSYILL